MTADLRTKDDLGRSHNLGKTGWISVLLGMAVALLRFLPEDALIQKYGDAQGGIAVAYAWIVAVVVCVFSGLLVFFIITGRSLISRSILSVLLLSIVLYQINSVRRFHAIDFALAAAGNQNTPPEVLSSLRGFDTLYFGYELDRRLASNGHSSEELLRELYSGGQEGVLDGLIHNPNTPEDILEKLRLRRMESSRKSQARMPGLTHHPTSTSIRST